MAKTDRASRYARLEQHWGPKTQEKVGDAFISVITDGPLGKNVASYLASAGFGNFRFFGDSKLQRGERHFWAIPLERDLAVVAYADALPKLNPDVNAVSVRRVMNNRFIADRLKRSSAIVDATNSMESKTWTLETAMLYGIPAVSASCSVKGASMQVYDPNRDGEKYEDLGERMGFQMRDYGGVRQDELVAKAWAGPVDEEVKRLVVRDGEPLNHRLEYSAPKKVPKNRYSNLAALVVGCGAAGSKAAPTLAHMGFGTVHCVDDDVIKSSNLPRVETLVGRDGEPKSDVLAEVTHLIYPKTETMSFPVTFDEFEAPREYDLVVSCVDNDAARGEVYNFAIEQGIAHINVGADWDGWDYALAVPGRTACIKHLYPGFEDQVKASEAALRHSCERTQPSNSWMQSVIIFALLHVSTAFCPGEAGEPFNGVVSYDANNRNRFELLRKRRGCDCYKVK